ncbi:major facilitator superfamily domain-containing protein [Aspergillus pseudonomiae]|uniref:Major facilitator superfamily domain-containing protein n=1 Tax=Aspergillus pseudonomiae TaxID=1506151 RepID=A0A5N6I057_9EURO|nr:major facilitator superfamily domain-containing protein [Aspergillus pseudonomiae]KAB8259367.1 major facilitator superfamily domain-containing protein [Aspergillus pseudonomiae]KAE8408290.1 major facilitator superfamily domain-containing protein [Aspergillus pseudonomiae]
MGRRDETPQTTTDPSPTPIDPPPDGGLNAWTQAVMGHLVCFNTWGYIASFGVFQAYYQSSLGVSSSAISWVGSVQIFLIFFIGTFSGRALDAGFFRPVYYTGVVLQLLGVFMTSLATRYWQLFLAQGICTGLGSGLQFCPVMGLVATYFAKRRVFALAFGLVGSGTGGMLFPGLVKALMPAIGFGWTLRVLGFVMLGTSIPAMTLLKPRLPPRRSGPLVEWSAFKEPAYVLFCLGMFLNFWGLYFAFYYVGAFGRSVIGLSYSDSTNLIIVTNGVGIVGRLIPAFLADVYFGPLNTIIPLALGASLMMFCWIAVHSVGGLYVFAVLYGMFSNGVQGLWPSTLSSLTPDLSKTGVRIGMGFTVVSFACLTGPPLGGALIARADGYIGAQIWGGLTFVLGALVLVTARVSKTGLQMKARI